MRLVADAINRRGLAKAIVSGRDRWEESNRKYKDDIVVMHNPGSHQQLKYIIDAHKFEWAKIVSDYDDNPFNLSPFNDAYRWSGTADIIHDGKLLWHHGNHGFDLDRNAETVKRIRLSMRKSDMITTTVKPLADALKETNDKCAVLPNCLDFSVWDEARNHAINRDREPGVVRIGWAGGSSHYEDMFMLNKLWKPLFKKHPNIRLVIFGCMFKGTVKEVPADRIENYAWVDVLQYPYKLATLGIDIAIIPLRETAFNSCKSPLKWLEFSALNIPCVCSNETPYKEVVSSEETGYLRDNASMLSRRNGQKSWESTLDNLIRDEILRKAVGQQAYEHVKANYDIDKNCHLWTEAYSRLLNGEVT